MHHSFKYKILNDFHPKSNIWEGLFIQIPQFNNEKTIILGNVYKPPLDNNNNNNIQTFIDEISPVIQKLGKCKASAIVAGDFNIDLIKANQRAIFTEYLDLFITNSFLPKITFPTRFSDNNCTLIDNIYL